MAHYAIIRDGLVTQVITGVDEKITQRDSQGNTVGGSSEAWENFYASQPHFAGSTVRRTSYNDNYRKNFAGIGYTYDAARDAFIAPKPFPSWTLNESTCRWEAPVAYPTDGKFYVWNEDDQEWVADSAG